MIEFKYSTSTPLCFGASALGKRISLGWLPLRDAKGKEIAFRGELDKARLKRAELECKTKPADLKIMKRIFGRYARIIVQKKAPRTHIDNKAEFKHLRNGVDSAPIDAITPAMAAQYSDARIAKTRANRAVALLPLVFNMARE